MTAPPAFSINIETVNLSDIKPERFARALKSLADQDYPVTNANEVILIDTGLWPTDLIRELCAPYPWIRIMPVAGETGYAGCKMLAVPHMSGEILLFCDSDVIYSPSWLRQMLAAFSEHPQIEVLAGDTSIEQTVRDKGIYGFAMAIAYLFPHFSEHEEIGPKNYYEANNVAFRRELLFRYPGPVDLPADRANLFVHALLLRRKGFTIWHQPKARSHHPVPKGWTNFIREFWRLGQDSAYISFFFRDFSGRTYLEKSRFRGRFDRVVDELRRDPRNWLRLPFALPIILAAFLVFGVSRVFGLVRPLPRPASLQQIWGDALP